MTAKPIYLDHQATTPLAPEALAAMLPWLSGPESTGFANPHSMHRVGRAAAAAVELAREQVAGLLPKGGRVIFTSGATEALNQAQGDFEFVLRPTSLKRRFADLQQGRLDQLIFSIPEAFFYI